MLHKKKYIIILGATGSIGTTTLALLKARNIFLAGFSYLNNTTSAKKILSDFPETQAIACQNYTLDEIKNNTSHHRRFFKTSEDLIHHINEKLKDQNHTLFILNAIVGYTGFTSTLCAINNCDYLLLANKESLVVGGELVVKKLTTSKRTTLLPIDSEHCSLFRLILSNKNDVDSYTITASGGSLRNVDFSEFSNLTKAQVLNHPTWEMGQKITVDSAGLVNKALELIEAHFLFNIPYHKLNAVIHPQSFVHALITHKDSSMSLHVSSPHMSLPIAYTLDFPFNSSIPNNTPSLSLQQIQKLEFFDVDLNKFPSFSLGLNCGKQAGNYSAVFNIANDLAVNLFLEDKIKFTDIFFIQQKAVKEFALTSQQSLTDLKNLQKSMELNINERFI